MLDVLKKHSLPVAGCVVVALVLSLVFTRLDPRMLGALVVTLVGLVFGYALLPSGVRTGNVLSKNGKPLEVDVSHTGERTAPNNNEILSHVLIVEDNPVALLTLSRLFSALGAKRIAKSESAEDALQLIGTEKFSLILTDYKLGGMDGVQLLEKVRRAGDETPLIILSATPDQPGVIKAAMFNHTDFFGKPIRRLELIKTLERFSRTCPAQR